MSARVRLGRPARWASPHARSRFFCIPFVARRGEVEIEPCSKNLRVLDYNTKHTHAKYVSTLRYVCISGSPSLPLPTIEATRELQDTLRPPFPPLSSNLWRLPQPGTGSSGPQQLRAYSNRGSAAVLEARLGYRCAGSEGFNPPRVFRKAGGSVRVARL